MAWTGLDRRRVRGAYGAARVLAFAFAGLVAVRYLRVDHRFLLPFLEAVGAAVFLRALGIAAALFVLCVLLGWSGRRGLPGFLACLAGLLTLLLLPGSRALAAWAWAPFEAQVDGLRATVLVAAGGACGSGLAVGARFGRRQPPLLGLLLLLGVPFLAVALAGGGAGALAGSLWVGWIARRLGRTAFAHLTRRAAQAEGRLSLLMEVAVGLCLLVSATLGLGAAGGCSREGLLLFLGGLTFLLLPGLREDAAALRAVPWRRPVALDPAGATGDGMAAALLLVLWVAALGPEVGADALGFRTAGPVQWMRAGAIAGLPEMMGSYGLCAGEVLNLLMLPLAGLPAAKVAQAGLGALAALGAARLVPSGPGRHLLLVGFWGSTLVWWQYAWGFVDLTQLFFFFASILALVRWLEEGGRPWLAAAGATGALAAAVKLNGAGALAIGSLAVLLVDLRRHVSTRRLAGDLGALLLPGLLFLAPWLLRCFLLTGNPLFPFANGLFRSPLAPAVLPAARFGVGLDPAGLLSLPWQIVFRPDRFVELGTWHPALLALAPLGLVGLARVRDRRALPWLGAGVLAAAAWIATDQNGRYSLFAVLFLLIPLAAGVGAESPGPGSRLRSPAALLLAAFLLAGLGIQLCRPRSWLWRGVDGPALPIACVLGGQSRRDYLAAVVPTFPAGEWMERNRARPARILQLTGIRDHLYFGAPATSLPHGIEPLLRPLDPVLSWKDQQRGPAEAHRRLLELGYTHLMFDSGWVHLARLPEAAWQGLYGRAFTDRCLEACHGHQGIRLYRIRAAPLDGPPSAPGPDLLGGAGAGPPGWEGDFRKEIAAVPDALYEIELDLRRPPARGSLLLQVCWLAAEGRGVLLVQKALDASAAPGRFRLLQTAPPSAATARVELRGGGAEVGGLQLRLLPAVSREHEEPR